MLFEGIKLMMVGMTTVLLFLVAMICLIQLVSYLTRGAAAKELAALEKERIKQAEARKKKANQSCDIDEDIAVIAAAVAAYEAEKYA
ncbi:MAG: OadG family protein [Desulfotalea sp.]